ncbi:hypothetical protein W824_08860 [Clavibacter cf. michiganensis LMG 26808]|uniref:Uncharacterized protein n=1 Tax=Clavibacter michiganensis TaxID=28447 RepID=A0A399NR72_9MICO|nr:hypothetical protein W824_08860 [Clavibacter cf. michiganensis LMG 26808]RII96670.1 hypothetical protein DZF96_10495 [Clavibacter michiganensis]
MRTVARIVSQIRRSTDMDRKPVPTWIAVLVLGVCEVICFALVRSEWSLVLFAVLTWASPWSTASCPGDRGGRPTRRGDRSRRPVR